MLSHSAPEKKKKKKKKELKKDQFFKLIFLLTYQLFTDYLMPKSDAFVNVWLL